jgi:ribosomal protein S18 acetylase RimI-like enzyme
VTHPLDRPIWSALETRQAHFARGDDLVRRFPADVSPFVAARDASPEAVAGIASQIADGDDVSLVEAAPPLAPEGISETRLPVFQMVWDRFSTGRTVFSVSPLGERDAADMLELATLTRPGPFRARTHAMGRFVGVREDGRLIAMAGERLNATGYHEISAVCTHPDRRGRGLGPALMRVVGQRILEEGDIPFLHTYSSNTTAVALYRRLGFEVRAEVTHAIWNRRR